MKKLILILSCAFSTACLAQNPHMLPSDLILRWTEAGKQCDSENGGVSGVFNAMFDKKPIPCIEKDLVAGELTRRGWCPEEVATQPGTRVTIWKNCRPANLLFVPLESAKDAKTEEIIRDYWFSLDNSVFEEKNNNVKEAAFYSASRQERPACSLHEKRTGRSQFPCREKENCQKSGGKKVRRKHSQAIHCPEISNRRTPAGDSKPAG